MQNPKNYDTFVAMLVELGKKPGFKHFKEKMAHDLYDNLTVDVSPDCIVDRKVLTLDDVLNTYLESIIKDINACNEAFSIDNGNLLYHINSMLYSLNILTTSSIKKEHQKFVMDMELYYQNMLTECVKSRPMSKPRSNVVQWDNLDDILILDRVLTKLNLERKDIDTNDTLSGIKKAWKKYPHGYFEGKPRGDKIRAEVKAILTS